MSARRKAYDALTDVTDRGAYANLRVKQLSRDLPEREAKYAAALVYTTLDHLLTIDYYLSFFVKGGIKPAVRGVLRLGVCELLYMHTPAHAAVNESVLLTREIGKGALSGFVNGVLRSVSRSSEASSLPALPKEPLKRLSIRYSYPEWIVSEWLAAYGEAQTEQLLSCSAAPVEVRAQVPFTTDELIAALPVGCRRNRWDENSLALETGFDVASSPLFTEGKFTVMGQGAMLVCRALGDMTKKRVLDACAAPGGKSAYLFSLCRGDVSLTCLEKHPHRAELLEKTLRRLHVTAESRVCDASEFDTANETQFDAVLVDAPCSGLGLLGDKPDLRYSKTDADVTALAALQKEILAACHRYVRPGGLLVYATCTISRRENELQTEEFLAEHADFTLERMPLPIENDGMLQLLPHVHGTDGFFIARMRKCI